MSKLKNVTGMQIFNIPQNAYMPHGLHSKMPSIVRHILDLVMGFQEKKTLSIVRHP
jgi:hypothetical protein